MLLPAGLADLDGLVSEQVGLRLAELAADVPADMAIVELGAYKGRSTGYLAAGAQAGEGAHVWTFDAWDLPGNVSGRHGYARRDIRSIFDQQLAKIGLQDQVTARRSRAVPAARDWEGPVGLLFVDASHLYEDVRADFEAWKPHVALGGVVAFDDYHTKRNPGVTRHVDELRADPAWGGWEFTPMPLAITRRLR